MMQLTLTLAPGLTQRHRTLKDCIQSAVMNSKGGVAGIAPALDMSPSMLGRKLANTNPDDPHRTLDVNDFDIIISKLVEERDLSPLYWLIEKYLPSDQQRREAALDQLSALMPRLLELAAEVSTSPRKRR